MFLNVKNDENIFNKPIILTKHQIDILNLTNMILFLSNQTAKKTWRQTPTSSASIPEKGDQKLA